MKEHRLKKIKYYLLILSASLYFNHNSFANPNTNLLLEQANQGNAKAQFAVGDLYYTGKFGPKNDSKAIEYYQKAANQGYAEAQYALGDMYYRGYGVAKNNTKAAEWFEKAANQNYPYAYISIGYLYNQGEGLPQNTLTAIKWFKKGSDIGDSGAQMALASIYLKGKDVPKDIEKSKYYLQQACLNKTPQGCNLLNILNKQP